MNDTFNTGNLIKLEPGKEKEVDYSKLLKKNDYDEIRAKIQGHGIIDNAIRIACGIPDEDGQKPTSDETFKMLMKLIDKVLPNVQSKEVKIDESDTKDDEVDYSKLSTEELFAMQQLAEKARK